MSKKIRLGIVGYGAEGRGRGHYLFALAAKSFDFIEPAAICDRDATSLAAAKEEFPKVPRFDDFDEMLKSAELDALLVETPATNHAVFCQKALENNIHVMSDIPCIHTVEEADALWQAEKQSSATFMTGANPNLWAFIESAVDLKQKGLLGEPYYVEASYMHHIEHMFERTPWRADYPPIRYCTHSLGPVLRLLDEDFKWVTSFDTGSHVNKVEGQHDAMAALLRTPSNVVVRLLVSFVNHYRASGHHYRFLTTKGCFERTPNYRTGADDDAGAPKTLFYSKDLYADPHWVRLPVDEMRPEYTGEKNAGGHGGADYALLDRFFRVISDGETDCLISLREGLRMSLPGVYAAESAMRGGELTKIHYPWEKE